MSSRAPGPVIYVVPTAGYSSADVDGSVPDNGRKACSEAVPVEQTSWSKIKSLY